MKMKEKMYNKLINPNARRILDVGCGIGKLGSALKQKLNAEVWGVEYVSDIASLAMERLDNVISGPIEDAITQLPDNYFDTIIFADVLEHLANPNKILVQIKEKLTPDGEIIASIPNVRFWPLIRNLIEGHWTYEESGILDFTHLRFFTLESMNDMFEKTGYKIITILGKIINDVEIPDEIVNFFAGSSLNVTTLKNESKFFQYIIKANNNEIPQQPEMNIDPAFNVKNI